MVSQATTSKYSKIVTSVEPLINIWQNISTQVVKKRRLLAQMNIFNIGQERVLMIEYPTNIQTKKLRSGAQLQLMLERCQLVALTSVTRCLFALDALQSLYATGNIYGYTYVLRQLMENIGDGLQTIFVLPLILYDEHDDIIRALNNEADASFDSGLLDIYLDHYFYASAQNTTVHPDIQNLREQMFGYTDDMARKQAKNNMDANFKAKHSAKYIRNLGLDSDDDIRKATNLYSTLCDISHPAKTSVAVAGIAWSTLQVRQKYLDKFEDKFMSLSSQPLNLLLKSAIITFAMINKIDNQNRWGLKFSGLSDEFINNLESDVMQRLQDIVHGPQTNADGTPCRLTEDVKHVFDSIQSNRRRGLE